MHRLFLFVALLLTFSLVIQHVQGFQDLARFRSRAKIADGEIVGEQDNLDLSDEEIERLGGIAVATAAASFLEVETQVKAWPPADNVDLNQIRSDFATEAQRVDAATFSPCTGVNHATTACTGDFVYTTDAAKKHRVTAVSGMAKLAASYEWWLSTNEQFGMKDLVRMINSRSANHLPTSGNLQKRCSVGHVVAGILGGSNNAPLNFFPQRAESNNGGMYHFMEEVVLNLLRIGGECGNNKLKLDITFTYTNDGDLVPNGGTYHVTIPSACNTAMYSELQKILNLKRDERTQDQFQQSKYFKEMKKEIDKANLKDKAVKFGYNWTN